MQPYSPYTPAVPTSYPPDAVTLPPQPAKRLHTWPAVLVLYFLAPIIGEMLSGSTPPLLFLNPVSLIFQPALYGSGAILARELVRRRGLGWPSLLLLGAAYGVLEEGLVVTSWFNPLWPDIGSLGVYGRLLDTNWVWAFELTFYHMVVSIAVPIILVEALFPRIADRPWLGRRGLRAFVVLLTTISLLGLLGFGFLEFNKQGYTHPPAMYFFALALAVALVVLALRRHPPAPVVPSARRTPRLWTLRLLGFLATIIYFMISWAVPSMVPLALVTMLLFAGFVLLAAWRVRAWSRRQGWGAEHRLALASGVLGFFLLLFAPLVEFLAPPAGKPTTGMTLVAVVFLIGLIWLARRTGKARVAQQSAIYPA